MSSLLKRISGTLKDAVLQMFGLQAAFGSGTGEAKFCLPEPPRLSDKGKVMNKQMNGLRKTDSDFEQRGSIRRSINIPCALRIRGAVFLARLLDLSAGGAFIEFKDPPACGTEISLIFRAATHGLSF